MTFWLFKNKAFLFFGEHGTELDYIVGTTITDLTNLKNRSRSTKLSPTTITTVIVGWNYMDSVFDFMYALSLFTDDTDYRYNYNVFKGIINVLEGVELFLFSYNLPLNTALGLKGETALAGTAFALGTVGDLIYTSMDFYHAAKQTYFLGWLDEQIKAYKYALKYGFETQEIIKNIRSRSKVYVSGDTLKLNELTTFFKDKLSTLDEQDSAIQKLTVNLDTVDTKNILRDQLIQNNVDQSYKSTRTFLGMKAISLVGMFILAGAGLYENTTDNPDPDSYSSTLTTGLILTTFVASYYTITNGERLVNKLGGLYHRFFSQETNSGDIELPEQQTHEAVFN